MAVFKVGAIRLEPNMALPLPVAVCLFKVEPSDQVPAWYCPSWQPYNSSASQAVSSLPEVWLGYQVSKAQKRRTPFVFKGDGLQQWQ